MQSIKNPFESLARIWNKTVGLWPQDWNSYKAKKWLLTRFYDDTGFLTPGLPKHIWPQDIKRFEWIESVPIKETVRRGIIKRNLRFSPGLKEGHVFELDFNDSETEYIDANKLSHVIFTTAELHDLRELYRLPFDVDEHICTALCSQEHFHRQPKDMWPQLKRGSVWSELVKRL